MLRLKIRTAEHSQDFETEEAAVTIGRASRNTLRIADDQSSREHCRIERLDDGSWKLADLASRNGTHLNGQLVDEHLLEHGDEIRIGSTTITLELPGTEHAAAASSAEERTAPEPEAPRAIELAFTAGSLKGRSEVVFEKLTTLGRQRRNSIVLSDRGVSNRHAEIRRGPDGFILVDVGSKNGTFLNGRLILRNPVEPGDQVRIGKTIVQVHAATVDADTAAQMAIEAEVGDAEEVSSSELYEQYLGEGPTWPRAVVSLAAVVVFALVVAYAFRRDIQGWVTSGPPVVPDLLGRRGSFDGTDAQRAWKAEANTDGRFEKGRLVLQLPSRGAVGALASYEHAEPLPVARDSRYALAARVRADGLRGGFAGIVATWLGKQSWGPQASVLLRAEAGSEPWAAAARILTPPPWANFLAVSCVATAESGSAAFDDVTVQEVRERASLPQFLADPLALVMDTPVLFSLAHGESLVTAGAGLVVEPSTGAAAIHQPRAEVASGYPKNADGRYQVRCDLMLPPQEAGLSIDQTVARHEDNLRVEYRVWTARETTVAFVGVELPCPAALLRRGLDVRMSSGFARRGSEEAAFRLDDAYGLTWHTERGKLFLASDTPLAVEYRADGARAVLRVGQRAARLRRAPLVLGFTLHGSTPADERKVVARLAAAERAARGKRYGQAIRLYQEIAGLYAHRRRESELAGKQLGLLRREAVERADEAVRLLERAELTGDGRDFEAARAALEPLLSGLKDTPHERKVVEALARCTEQRRVAEQRQRESQAAIVLRGAQEQAKQRHVHIGRLYCRELLARFPRTRAAADATALLQVLNQPAPAKPPASTPRPATPKPASPAPRPQTPRRS